MDHHFDAACFQLASRWLWLSLHLAKRGSERCPSGPNCLGIHRECATLKGNGGCYIAPQDMILAKHGKSMWKQLMENRLIEKRLSKQDAADLAASCQALPVDPEKWGLFVRGVVNTVPGRVDREALVELLSKRCPYGYGDCSIEFWLAIREIWGDGLKYPITVLFDAYSKCQIPEVRNLLIWSIRRGFAGHGISGKDDAEYVKNAMQWYEKNKDHLVANEEYSYREWRGPVEKWQLEDPQYFEKDLTSRKGEPLFKVRPASASPPRRREPGQAVTKASPSDSQRADNRTNAQQLANLQGTWEVTEMRVNGRLVPQKNVKGERFVFRKETLTEICPDVTKHVEYRIKLGFQQELRRMDLIRTIYKLKPPKGVTPSALDLLIEELNHDTTAAIYELKGDSLRICRPCIGCERRPTSFEAEEGFHESVTTLKRVKE